MKKFNAQQLEQNRKKLKREKEKLEYIAKMKYIADAAAGEGTFDILPPQMVENAYKGRVLSFKVNADNAKGMAQKQIKKIQHTIDLFSRDEVYQMEINNKIVLLADYMTAGLTLQKVVLHCKSYRDTQEWAVRFAERFKDMDTQDFYAKGVITSWSMAGFALYDYIDMEKQL